MNKLNLGCGLDYRESTDTDTWTNMDIDENVKTDWCGDANKMPDYDSILNSAMRYCEGYNLDLDKYMNIHKHKAWDNRFDHIYSHHSLEHFKDLFIIVDEMARVSKDRAEWEIIVPYCTWTQGLGNPHHHILFHENTFRFFDKGENGIHKRREQDYSIETVKVEYGWNDMVIWELQKLYKIPTESNIIQPSWRDIHLNVVREITFHLKVHK